MLAPAGVAVAKPKRYSAYDASVKEGEQGGKPSHNQAVCWSGKEQVSVQDIGYPKMQTPAGVPIDHGVILKVVASAICGSDLHMYRGSFVRNKDTRARERVSSAGRDFLTRFMLSCAPSLQLGLPGGGMVKPGFSLGHEITGEVFEMGPSVERFEVGDMVSVPFNIACGHCSNVSRQTANSESICNAYV